MVADVKTAVDNLVLNPTDQVDVPKMNEQYGSGIVELIKLKAKSWGGDYNDTTTVIKSDLFGYMFQDKYMNLPTSIQEWFDNRLFSYFVVTDLKQAADVAAIAISAWEIINKDKTSNSDIFKDFIDNKIEKLPTMYDLIALKTDNKLEDYLQSLSDKLLHRIAILALGNARALLIIQNIPGIVQDKPEDQAVGTVRIRPPTPEQSSAPAPSTQAYNYVRIRPPTPPAPPAPPPPPAPPAPPAPATPPTPGPTLTRGIVRSPPTPPAPPAPPTPPVDDFSTRGIINGGNTCYINAVLQMLYSMRKFRTHILDNDFTNEHISNLKKVFQQLNIKSDNKAININEIIPSCLKVMKSTHGTQEDASEFITQIINEVSSDNVQLQEMLQFQLISTTKCGEENRAPTFELTTKLDLQLYDPIQIKDKEIKNNTLQELITNYERSEKLDNRFEDCDSSSFITRTINILNNTEYFIISLVRFDGVTKNDKHITANNIIIVKNISFRLIGYVYHDGKYMKSGHYVYVQYNAKKQAVRTYNDETVHFNAINYPSNKGYVYVYERVKEV